MNLQKQHAETNYEIIGTKNIGLRGIEIADTKVSYNDPLYGKLVIEDTIFLI